MPNTAKKLKTNEERVAFLNAKVEELAIDQQQELVADYDEVLKEWQEQEENKPHKIRFKGKVFEVPRSIPFSFSLFYMRNCIQKQGGQTLFVIPDDKISEFIEKMFGKKFLSMLDQSDDVELTFVINKLIPDIMGRWGYGIKKPKNT